MRDLEKFFEEHSDKFLVQESPYYRRDLQAFNRINELVPGNTVMVSAAAHDQIWLGVDPDALNAAASDDDLIFLMRCGVGYDSNEDGFYMFV